MKPWLIKLSSIVSLRSWCRANGIGCGWFSLWTFKGTLTSSRLISKALRLSEHAMLLALRSPSWRCSARLLLPAGSYAGFGGCDCILPRSELDRLVFSSRCDRPVAQVQCGTATLHVKVIITPGFS